MGNIGLLNVTFSTKTLPELLTFHDAFDVLIKYDQEVIKVYRDTIDQLVRVTTALDLEKSVLDRFYHANHAGKRSAADDHNREERLFSPRYRPRKNFMNRRSSKCSRHPTILPSQSSR